MCELNDPQHHYSVPVGSCSRPLQYPSGRMYASLAFQDVDRKAAVAANGGGDESAVEVCSEKLPAHSLCTRSGSSPW